MCLELFLGSLFEHKIFVVEVKFVINFPIYIGVFYFSGNASYGSCLCVPIWLPSLPRLLPWHNVSCCLLYYEFACCVFCLYSHHPIMHTHEIGSNGEQQFITLYQTTEIEMLKTLEGFDGSG